MNRSKKPELNAVPAGQDAEPDPEVLARPKRRHFTAKEKLTILKEVDSCTEPGAIGAILRREGIYSSYLTEWRREREAGALWALSKRRGRKPTRSPLADDNDRLRREVSRLQQRLEQAETIIEVQKKVSEILGIPLKRPAPDGSDS